jgi:hypothetical protein
MGAGSAVQGMTLGGRNADGQSAGVYPQRLMWIEDRPAGFGFTGGCRIEALIDVSVPSNLDSTDLGFRVGTTEVIAQDSYTYITGPPAITRHLVRFVVFLRNTGGPGGGTTRHWSELWIENNATDVMTNVFANQGSIAENIVTLTTALEVVGGDNVGTGVATARHMIVTPYFTDFT